MTFGSENTCITCQLLRLLKTTTTLLTLECLFFTGQNGQPQAAPHPYYISPVPQQMQRPYYPVAGAGPAGPTMHGARPRWPTSNPMQRLPANAYPPRGAPSGRHGGGPPVSTAARLVSASPRPITGHASIPTRQQTAPRPPQAGRQTAAFNTSKPMRPTVSIIDS